ncbi:glycerate kinase [Shewanella sp. 202IG2-18]|uniref:glycerate kinase n=1 Tax=Parashewanella hymeniacidonis TaxID=2807618 RepID=UPI0019612B46|nr:glycerate kinase [Parashewanella hymeniacidonis]MBM7071729.1 glycerate kinase [Parashewanella hymeniacidonis]
MKSIIVAPDSFKESLTATQVADAIAEGILAVNQNIEVIKLPIADGGEGTLDALSGLIPCTKIPSLVTDALGLPMHNHFLLASNQRIAMIEVAQSCGLAQIAPNQRDPMQATSYGVGQQMELAIELGVDEIVLALGGSATNDCGAGLLQALGARYRDKNGQEILVSGGNLCQIKSIDISELNPRLAKTKITLLCDVTNPLFGKAGASHTFGSQKGASAQQIDILENNIQHFAVLLDAKFGKPLSNIEGAGAAGGIPAVLIAICNAQLTSGIDYILERSEFSTHLQNADLVITGEGKIDTQSVDGKALSGVAKQAMKAGVPVIALAGSVTCDVNSLNKIGITAAFSICNQPLTLEQAFKDTSENLKRTAENVTRLLLC